MCGVFGCVRGDVPFKARPPIRNVSSVLIHLFIVCTDSCLFFPLFSVFLPFLCLRFLKFNTSRPLRLSATPPPHPRSLSLTLCHVLIDKCDGVCLSFPWPSTLRNACTDIHTQHAARLLMASTFPGSLNGELQSLYTTKETYRLMGGQNAQYSCHLSKERNCSGPERKVGRELHFYWITNFINKKLQLLLQSL